MVLHGQDRRNEQRLHKRPKRDLDNDIRLARAVTSGDVPAWHEFVERYSGLIYGVLRRHLFVSDDDRIRTIFTDILEGLYKGHLEHYDGRAPLATWLTVVARCRAFDAIRQERGRYRDPAAFDKLSELDREVLQLFYVERMDIEIVVQTLSWRGRDVAAQDIVDAIQRIEDAVSARFLRRLEHEHQARRAGVRSVSLLKYLIHAQRENENRISTHMSDVNEQEIRAKAKLVRKLVERLPAEERRVIELRFDGGLTAETIANRVGEKSRRRIYTVIDRAIRRLREMVKGEDLETREY